MRDDTVYALVKQLDEKINQVAQQGQQIVQFIQNFQQAIRLDSTGKEIRLLGIQRLLLKKQVATEIEFTNFVDKLILVLAAKLALTDDEIVALKTELKLSLIKSSLITEVELTAESGKVIQEMQAQAEAEAAKAAAPEIVVPTTEQVQQVATPVSDAAVKDVVAPQ